jgi:hypothetical protein
MRCIRKSEGYYRTQEQLLGMLMNAQDSQGIRQKCKRLPVRAAQFEDAHRLDGR